MSFLASNVNKAICSCFWVPMAITEILLSSMKQNWYFWVAKLGVTSIFRLPCKTSLWLFDWVGGFENYKLWGFHCDIKGETLKPFLWRYTFFRVLFLCLRGFFFVVFCWFHILCHSSSLWQFKHCLADWVEIHVIRSVTNWSSYVACVCYLDKIELRTRVFLCQCSDLIICSIRPWNIAWYIMAQLLWLEMALFSKKALWNIEKHS